MEQNKPKFKVGDTVEIIGYGSLAWIPKSEVTSISVFKVIQEAETYFIVDTSPNEVGEKGIVREITTSQGRVEYALAKSGKQAWFYEEQLKLKENEKDYSTSTAVRRIFSDRCADTSHDSGQNGR